MTNQPTASPNTFKLTDNREKYKWTGGFLVKDQFKLVSKYSPQGDQPEAIRKIVEGIQSGKKHQTLLGATGRQRKEFKFFYAINIVFTLE